MATGPHNIFWGIAEWKAGNRLDLALLHLLLCKNLRRNGLIKIKEQKNTKPDNVTTLLLQPRDYLWTNQIADKVTKLQM